MNGIRSQGHSSLETPSSIDLRLKHISQLGGDADPFSERPLFELDLEAEVLGARVHFTSNVQALLELVRHAYAGLPVHRLDRAAQDVDVRLRFAVTNEPIREPPPLQLCSGGGMLCGIVDAHNFALMCPERCSALVSISDGMLAHPYHARYELIEFAVYTLVARSQALVPLHAACVGRAGRGVLLIGETGAGKSTLALHCLVRGLQLLSEDSVFVNPSLLATGVGTFLHLRTDDPLRVDDSTIATLRSNAATIRRRSGIVKHALDLRGAPSFIAREAFAIAAIVLVSKEHATRTELLSPIAPSALRERLAKSQVYAASQPGWSEFLERAGHLPAFELRRAHDPDLGAAGIASLLADASI